MVGQRDLASKRLEQLIEFENQYGGLITQYFEPWEATAFALEQEASDVPIWQNPKARFFAADAALKLTSAEYNEPIRKAFDTFGLDPRNPFHWRKLLWYLAQAFFGKPNLRRPKTWSSDRWCRLLQHFHEVSTSDPRLTEQSVCQLVKNRFDKHYRGIDGQTIRRNLQYARDPQRNPVLEHCYESYRRNAVAKHDGPLTAEIQKRLESDALKSAIQQISCPQRHKRRG
jgi:hypothetical protein